MKKLNILSATYLLITGIISIFNILVILSKSDISNLLLLVSIVFLCFAISTTIINNFFILRSLGNIQKNKILINVVLCLTQSFRLSLSGFQFKFNQGLETNIYTEIDNTINNFKIGAYFSNFNLSLNIEFLELDYTQIEINVLALLLTVFYWIQYNKYNKEKPSLIDTSSSAR